MIITERTYCTEESHLLPTPKRTRCGRFCRRLALKGGCTSETVVRLRQEWSCCRKNRGIDCYGVVEALLLTCYLFLPIVSCSSATLLIPALFWLTLLAALLFETAFDVNVFRLFLYSAGGCLLMVACFMISWFWFIANHDPIPIMPIWPPPCAAPYYGITMAIGFFLIFCAAVTLAIACCVFWLMIFLPLLQFYRYIAAKIVCCAALWKESNADSP